MTWRQALPSRGDYKSVKERKLKILAEQVQPGDQMFKSSDGDDNHGVQTVLRINLAAGQVDMRNAHGVEYSVWLDEELVMRIQTYRAACALVKKLK